MKKIIALLVVIALIALLLFCPIFTPKQESNEFFAPESGALTIDYESVSLINSARCAVVIDCESKSVLLQKNCDERRGMASTTKIMTALLAIESLPLDTPFEIPKEACGIEGSSVYLKAGEVLTLRELLYCLMLESGNDAAVAIAYCIGGDLEGFVEMMNRRAGELSLENTHFSNPHGLSDENHYTTARELAIITAEAFKHDVFREIVATKTYKVPYDGIENGRHLVNHNKMLFSYSDIVGVKTGYTQKDGKCLVSASFKNEATLIAVTLQDNHPVSTHRNLLNQANDGYEKRLLAESGELKSEVRILGEEQFLKIQNEENHSLVLPKSAKIEIEFHLVDFVALPVKRGDAFGYASVKADDKEVYIIYLESTESIDIKKKSLIEILFGNEKKWKA